MEVTTFRASGPGGQHRNKTSSAVRIKHLPTGVIAIAAESRSQHRNRLVALERLRSRLEEMFAEERPRISTPVPRRQKQHRLRDKKLRSKVKTLRQPPEPDED